MSVWPRKHVDVAANGHLSVNWPDAGHTFSILLRAWLRIRYGLRPDGKTTHSPDAIIFPDLTDECVRLKAGWDIWSGYYLLSEDHAGDILLKRAFAPQS